MRLEGGLSSSLEEVTTGDRWGRRGLSPFKDTSVHFLDGCDDELPPTARSVSPPVGGRDVGGTGGSGRDGKGPGGAAGAPGPRRRGRTRLRPSGVSGATASTSCSIPRVSGGGGGGGGRRTGAVRCLSSPAVAGGTPSFSSTRSINRKSSAGASDGWTTTTVALDQIGDRELIDDERGAGPSRGARFQQPGGAPATPATTTTCGPSMLTMQTCFKQEREAFIRDLQVLHRQLEAKDRDHARRQKENEAACALARTETRTAIERTFSLRKEAEDAATAQAEAEARTAVAVEGLDRFHFFCWFLSPRVEYILHFIPQRLAHSGPGLSVSNVDLGYAMLLL